MTFILLMPADSLIVAENVPSGVVSRRRSSFSDMTATVEPGCEFPFRDIEVSLTTELSCGVMMEKGLLVSIVGVGVGVTLFADLLASKVFETEVFARLMP